MVLHRTCDLAPVSTGPDFPDSYLKHFLSHLDQPLLLRANVAYHNGNSRVPTIAFQFDAAINTYYITIAQLPGTRNAVHYFFIYTGTYTGGKILPSLSIRHTLKQRYSASMGYYIITHPGQFSRRNARDSFLCKPSQNTPNNTACGPNQLYFPVASYCNSHNTKNNSK
jgi:hypothetical protein